MKKITLPLHDCLLGGLRLDQRGREQLIPRHGENFPAEIWTRAKTEAEL